MNDSLNRSMRMKAMLEQLDDTLEAWGEMGDVSPFDAAIVTFEAINRFMARVNISNAYRFDMYTTAMKRSLNIDPMLNEKQAIASYRRALTAEVSKGTNLDDMTEQVLATFEMMSIDFETRTRH